MRNVRFLIVDDSALVLGKVRKVLENKFGTSHIIKASNGAKALEALKKENIDIIISDWNMPEVNGEELLFEVRNSDKWKNIPFIMMTSNCKRDFIVTAIQNGVTNYVIKPFTPAELEDKIRRSWNSACRRRSERFSLLAEHRLVVKFGEKVFPAQIINISRTGSLVRLKYSEDIQLFKQYRLILELKRANEDEMLIIKDLYGVAVRLEVENCFLPSSSICLMALSFIPSMMKREVEATLDKLMDHMDSLKPHIIGNE